MRTSITAALLLAIAFTATPEIPEGYYFGLDGKKKEELKTAAKKAVRNHTVISYGTDTWEAFEETDVKIVNGTKYWWDMYSNNLVSVSSGHSGLNIEHSVANSWWGKTKNDAYKDLFHLNPSDAEANNRKSNYPLGIVVSATYDNGVTKVGHPASGDCGGATWAYEPPNEYKGDFARAFFYIFTVYDDMAWQMSADRDFMYDGTSYPSLRPWAYEMLLEWNRLDPVSQKEIDRNNAIYRIQNNRNPFIDLPELAEHIWGTKTHIAFDSHSGQGTGDNDNPEPGGRGNGTEREPYDVEYVLTHTAEEQGVWVEGYAVGYVEGYIYDSGCTFSNETDGANYTNTNCLLGPSADCTDPAKCIALQLPKGTMREELGLGNNPAIYGKHIRAKGNLTSYFSRPGLKGVEEYALMQSSVAANHTERSSLAVWNADGDVWVTDMPGTEVTLCDAAGRPLMHFTAEPAPVSLTLRPGFYVIFSQNGARKVIVR